MWIAAAAAAALVAAGAGGIAWAVARGGGAESGPCRLQTFPAQKAMHVPPAKLPKGFKYNSFPPTSGPHHPTPAVWGVYDQPVGENHLVHNLEHGGIVIQYGKDVPRSELDELIGWYRKDPNAIVIAPLPDRPEAKKLSRKITLAAWWSQLENENDPRSKIVKEEGRLLTCSRFDADAVSDFRDDNRGHGPERFLVTDLTPGSQ